MKKAAWIGVVMVSALVYGTWELSRARTFQLSGQLVSRVVTEHPIVALTFDDGPTSVYTKQTLAVLREHGARGTFFVTGRETEKNFEVAKQIVGEGHELGNHSYSHQRLVFKTPTRIREEVERTDAIIRSTDYAGDIYFRPPYGKKLFGLPRYLARNRRTTIMWDVEPESYPDVANDAERMAAYVVVHVQPGSIVLLHVMYDSRVETRKALPGIIEGLRERGYQFLTVSELLNYHDLRDGGE